MRPQPFPERRRRRDCWAPTVGRTRCVPTQKRVRSGRSDGTDDSRTAPRAAAPTYEQGHPSEIRKTDVLTGDGSGEALTNQNGCLGARRNSQRSFSHCGCLAPGRRARQTSTSGSKPASRIGSRNTVCAARSLTLRQFAQARRTSRPNRA